MMLTDTEVDALHSYWRHSGLRNPEIATGTDLFETLVHEVAHLVDAGESVPDALDTASYGSLGISGLYPTVRRADLNEIRTTAITVHTLSGFLPGYDDDMSVSSMYANLRGNRSDFKQTYDRYMMSPRVKRLAARIRAHLFTDRLAEALSEHQEDIA